VQLEVEEDLMRQLQSQSSGSDSSRHHSSFRRKHIPHRKASSSAPLRRLFSPGDSYDTSYQWGDSALNNLPIPAGFVITKITLTTAGTGASTWDTNTPLKWAVEDADSTTCQETDPRLPASSPWATRSDSAAVSDPASAARDTSSEQITSTSDSFTFTMGGEYTLCYKNSLDGWAAWPSALTVYGVYHETLTENWPLSNVFNCYMLREAHNNPSDTYSEASTCVINYTGVQKAASDGSYHGSWSSKYADASTVSECGVTTPASELCTNGDSCSGGNPVVPKTDDTQFALPSTTNSLSGTSFVPFTVSACYCAYPSYCISSSTSYDGFRQQVGVVHFYTSRLCRADDATCTSDYDGVTPQLRFRVRVNCPAYAETSSSCTASLDHRIKLVHQNSTDLPSWNEGNACYEYTHGKNAVGRDVLDSTSPDVTAEATYSDASATQKDVPTSTTYTGGFVFNSATASYESLNFHSQEMYDVCYCDSECTTTGLWFKVGQFRYAGYRLVSATDPTALTPQAWALEYVKEAGILGFRRENPKDYNVMGLTMPGSLGGIIKIVEDNDIIVDDATCASSAYSKSLVESANGLSADTAISNYRGTTAESGAATDLDKVIFNSGDLSNMITVLKSGVIAICYCQWASATECDSDDYWVMASRLTVKGPIEQIATNNLVPWEFSTNVVFRIEYRGYGLTSDNKLRIISADGKCSDNGSNPDKASFAYTSLRVGAPTNPTDVGSVDAAVNGDLVTQVTSSDAFQCNEFLEGCKTNDIKSIVVQDSSKTYLEFEIAPEFDDGDILTLGDNINCDPVSTVCTAEKLAQLKGVYTFADAENDQNNIKAPDTYIVGHKVSKVFDSTSGEQLPKIYSIPIGWDDECPPALGPKATVGSDCGDGVNGKPLFEVDYVGGRRGQWVRGNRAVTKWEIIGTKERANMRVCWHYGSTVGKFVQEVGKLTLTAPNPMDDCRVSLTTSLTTVRSPFVISFRTASAMTGQRYTTAQGSTQVKFLFNNINALEAYYSDYMASTIEEATGEDEITEAQQYVCGRLFRELWSDDVERGFPMPKGCYYKKYGVTREIFILFEAKSGLAPGKNYQVVMNGAAFFPTAKVESQLVEIFTMDDVDVNPYIAIEYGAAPLSKSAEEETMTDADPKWLVPGGFTVLGGVNQIVQLEGADSLRVQLAGDPIHVIRASMIVRIFLWPLTMWKTGSSCTASCTPNDEVQYVCGDIQDCKGEPTVLNSNNNVLKITLPGPYVSEDDPMTTISGPVRQTLSISGVTIPNGGFFPTRVGAQITNDADGAPHYVESSGDYYWKEPDDGQNIAKLVNVIGDGNHRPFKGDLANVLYVRFLLAITLFSGNAAGDASMKVTLPEGYNCTIPDQMGLDIDYNPWEAPTDLELYEQSIPQGRGSPTTRDITTTSHGWTQDPDDVRICYFTLNQYGVIYAGSSFFVKFTVNNPVEALNQGDILNKWSFELTSKGSFSNPLTTKEQIFKAIESNYTSSVAVRGYITEAVIQPSDFIGAFRDDRVVHPTLYIFFKSEQSAGQMPFIVIRAPADVCSTESGVDDDGVSTCQATGWAFDTREDIIGGCSAANLPAQYYAKIEGIDGTNPIPGEVASCFYHKHPHNEAKIHVTGIIDPDTRYGFQLQAVAPYDFDATQQTSWKIFTLDSLSQYVDGTPEHVPYLDQGTGVTHSYAVYENDLNSDAQNQRAFFSVADMKPSVIEEGATATTTTIEFLFTNFQDALSISCAVRVVAPAGYEFDPGNTWHVQPPDIDATWPVATAPTVDATKKNVITFASATYTATSADTVLGFRIGLVVPNYNPVTSPANFLVEFGYDGTTLATRPYAAILPAQQVQSLTNAVVDYSTNVEGKENTLTFQVQTQTDLEAGGGLYIVGPDVSGAGTENFQLASVCQVVANQMGEGYLNFPSDVECESGTVARGVATLVTIKIKAYATTMPKGLYRFSVLSINPVTAVANQPSDSSCGYTQCWEFHTYTDLANLDGIVDKTISAVGFPINTKLIEGRLIELTDAQRLGTARDDRPKKVNNLVFAFKMANDALEETDLLLRGPQGFVFDDDCTTGVETREEAVFGSGNKWPPIYEKWPYQVEVTSCRGIGSVARMRITPTAGVTLLANMLYAFRIQIKHNPPFTPFDNSWTIDINGESSEQFDGFILWTFTDVMIEVVHTAATPLESDPVRIKNPIAFTFASYNTIDPDIPYYGSGGLIRITAPEGVEFEFHHVNFECEALRRSCRGWTTRAGR
jgi:hypothetical protein